MDKIDQTALNWLNNTYYDNTKIQTKEENKPKFVKLLSNRSTSKIWYKVSESSTDDTEILVEATPKEIEKWNLK